MIDDVQQSDINNQTSNIYHSMQQLPEPGPLLFAIAAIAALATGGSLWTWLVISVKLRRGEPLLEYSPRRPVPWELPAALFAILMALMAVASLFAGTRVSDERLDELTKTDVATSIAGSIGMIAMLTAAFVIIAIARYGARAVDLGLPGSISEALRDVRIGFVAWLAALVPVYGLQAALVTFFKQPSEHPLIEIMLNDPGPLLIGLVWFSAAIAAPICEEITFRLLLQGFLEKWDKPQVAAPELLTDPPIPELDELVAEESWDEEPFDSIGFAGLPRGWMPIGISAFLFAIAHVGHGPDPIALFVLAIVLGYVYHRTHRILPCIILHMLFNGLSLLSLMTMIGGDS